MTSFDFDVIGDTPRKPLPNVQKPPAEKASGEKPAQSLAETPTVPEKEHHRAA
ncbi:hypothetical protein [Dongia sp.]|uniref:hypothetical protein n=1 Tax=Dongia sp. TaxID=1977262 RepID=UPI0035ADB217